MMQAEMPTVMQAATSSNCYQGVGSGLHGQMNANQGQFLNQHQQAVLGQYQQSAQQLGLLTAGPNSPPQPSRKIMADMKRRIVQVFIVDPDEGVPLVDSVLYSGEQKLTDLTDQELFFEVDIKSLLDAHNTKRAALFKKDVKDRKEPLDPARIRDLKMIVVNVATF